MARKAQTTFNINKQDRENQEAVVCSKCKGRGMVASRVVHLGVPGLCYKCDGHGKVYFVTTEQARQSHLEGAKAELDRIAQQAEEAKALAAEALERRNARRARRGLDPLESSDYRDRELERQLEQLRDAYRRVRAEVRLCEAGDWPRLDRQARLNF